MNYLSVLVDHLTPEKPKKSAPSGAVVMFIGSQQSSFHSNRRLIVCEVLATA